MVCMRIIDAFGSGAPAFSFEFFPPKTEQGVANLFETVSALRDLEPAFVSVTYGAGGSTRELTLELVARIRREAGIEAMAHLTCVGATREELSETLDRLADAGIENVLALRGDPPRGETEFTATPGGLSFGSDLAELARERGTFCVGGACYPEGHVEAADLVSDLAHLRRKVDAGVEFLITQLFFSNDAYFAFVARARAAGIDVPIIPGIMPITNLEQIERFTAMCGASIPRDLRRGLQVRRDDPQAIIDLGVAYATVQCADLLRRGAPGIHFYTLNRSPATRAILSALRIARPWEEPVLSYGRSALSATGS
jgi:methylenetetrahydrofolate reductase (NADPH)